MRAEDETNWDEAKRHYERVKVLEERRDYARALEEAEIAVSLCPEQRSDDTLSQYTLRAVLEKKVARLRESMNETANSPIEAFQDQDESVSDEAALALD